MPKACVAPAWSADRAIDWRFTVPRKPMQNGLIKKMAGHAMNYLTNCDLDDARAKIADRRLQHPAASLVVELAHRNGQSRYGTPTRSADHPLLHPRRLAHKTRTNRRWMKVQWQVSG